ncbi:MAG TPA: 2-oxo acid dehydrogenase subunit E2 [Actinomycetes bacterium]
MAEFKMPSLGADMDEGTVIEWLVKPGDPVHRGDVVAVVDTAKSAIEVEIFEDGVIAELLVPLGSTVPVGTPLARLAPAGAAPAAPEEPAAEPSSEPAAEPAAEHVVEHVVEPAASPLVRHLAHERGIDLAAVPASGQGGTVTRADLEHATPAPATPSPAAPASAEPPVGRPFARAVPRARARAAELGIDLSALTGTGPDGAVTVADVQAAAAGQPVEKPAAGEELAAGEKPASSDKVAASDKAAAMRAAIAALMARSKKEIPHYYLQATVDLSHALGWVRERNEGRGVADRLVPAAVLLKATALAVRRVPEVNGFFVDGGFQPSEHVHLGVAVALRGGGLVAPAIHDADTLPMDDLMAALKDLVARARAGRLRGSEMSDPTITVTNLGDQGVELVHGVIYPPQVALVGFGRVVERPWAVDGMLTVRPVLTATLAADHRVTDGHRGGLFLAAIETLLQKPEEL